MKKLNLSKNDIILILSLYILGLLVSVFPFPIVAATIVALSVITVRLFSGPEQEKGETSTASPNPEINRQTEQKIVQEIMEHKLKDGTFEQTIREQLEKTINDLFDANGEITRQIEGKLKDAILTSIEQHDFTQHHTKTENKTNQNEIPATKEQDQI